MRYLLLLSLLFYSALSADERTEFCSQDRICVVYVQDEFGADIYFRNQIALPATKVTLEIDAKVTNMKSSRKLPLTTILSGNGEQKLFRLNVNNSNKKWIYQINYRWILGDYNAQHDDSIVYDLPIEKGKKIRINQAYNGEKSHSGDNRYAIDFGLVEGSIVTAARDGVVIDTEDRFTEGGFDMKFINSANYVKVLHNDGTIAQYAHLKPQGVVVRRGQSVTSGQILGYSGNTGYSDGPHLHFEVYKPTLRLKKETIPTKFRTSFSDAEELVEGYLYWRREQGVPPQSEIVDREGIRICTAIVETEGVGCGLPMYSSKSPFVIYIPIVKPDEYRITVSIKKNGPGYEPKNFKWDTKSEWWITYLEVDLKDEGMVVDGDWTASISVDGIPIRDVNFSVEK